MIDSFTGEYRFLSNFYVVAGLSAEHQFQAMKTTNWMEQLWILSAKDPSEAKKRGRKVALRHDWDEIKLDVMEEVVRYKFDQPLLRQLLLATGDEELVEGNTWGDDYWGKVWDKVQNAWVGSNHLGLILMKIREELRS